MSRPKKYTLSYCNGPTGFGWEKEFDTLDEFEGFVDSKRNDRSAYLSVWDESMQKIIFLKNVLTYKPRIDMLHAYARDMRTTTRKAKGF